MEKSATDVMHEIILSAVTDSIDALKRASRGMPNTLLRDINAIHPNAAFADLPRELQVAIAASVRAAFNRLLKEGYSVSQGRPAPPSPSAPAGRRPQGPGGPGGRPPRPGTRPPPRGPKPASPRKR
ncbi:MAG TPA: hypothetical protein VNT77_11230 [Allosphingosinicella sp.]|nr:hypothetical protein [Allosphingosinicella sp.]